MNTVLEPEPLKSAPKAKPYIDAGPRPEPIEELTTQHEGAATITEEKPTESHPLVRRHIKTAIRVCVTLAVATAIALLILAVLGSMVMC